MTIPRLVLPLGLVAAMAPVVTSAQSAAPPPKRDAQTAAPAVEPHGRVVVTAPFAPAYSCAAVTCRVVTELDKGAVVSVVKTDGEWHQVLVRTAANAMTTGWVKAAQVTGTSGATVRTGNDRTDGVFRPAPGAADASGAATAGADDPRGCLTCLATREPTPDEWHAALADAATKKVTPEPDRVTPGLADGRTGDERAARRMSSTLVERGAAPSTGIEAKRWKHDARYPCRSASTSAASPASRFSSAS